MRVRRPRMAICIGTVIAYYRRKAGITQCELAERASIDPKYPSALETGKRMPTVDVFLRVMDALRVDPAQAIKRITTSWQEASEKLSG